MLQALKKILQRGRQGKAEVLGVEISPEGLSIACLSIGSGQIVSHDFRSCGPGEWPDQLIELVRQYNLSGLDAYFSLHPKFYNMLLVDAPDVDDAELSDAVRWRVKDLISQALDDVVVDVFRLPPEAYRGRMNMIYASIVERQVVLSIVEASDNAGLNLASIGINELSLCQYGKQLDSVENAGLAFVTLEEHGGVINLTENGLLFLSRTIDIGLNDLAQGETVGELSLDNGSRIDALALDIQRSLDYYESQLGKSAAVRIIFLPTDERIAQIIEDLKGKVSIELEILDLAGLFELEESESKGLDLSCMSIGAALFGSQSEQSKTMKGGGRGAILSTS